MAGSTASMFAAARAAWTATCSPMPPGRSARDGLARIVEEWWFGARHVGSLTLTTSTGSVRLDHDSADAPDRFALPELLHVDES
ncbi:hypothetical protein [Streptomyces sp. HB132]|uniref:hypothetical protein n=1 Tax=Streptomyces sp. HB132 TaxID=767388 RepID=UPI0019614D30|nr:hypothetical protein [Streptomyces sp. HB132]MBM7440467.1 hypothetical protein [Streptomyces sp. HB132]